MVTRAHQGVEITLESLGALTGIARDAGAVILQYYLPGVAGRPPEIKADGSPVTLADYAAQSLISEKLQQWDPAVPIISEEADLPSYDARRHWRRFWLVDPLDGTKEFITGNGEFTVNIALIEDGEPVLGVVYAPALDVMYAAASGLGAWRTDASDAPVRISHLRPPAGEPMVVVESRSHPSPELESYLGTIAVRDRIAIGSSLKFCWVAEGRAHIYPRLGPTMEWDVAAGDCVYRNSALEGRHSSPLGYNKPDLRNEPFVVGAAPSWGGSPALV